MTSEQRIALIADVLTYVEMKGFALAEEDWELVDHWNKRIDQCLANVGLPSRKTISRTWCEYHGLTFLDEEQAA